MNILAIVAIVAALIGSGSTYWGMSNYYDAQQLDELLAVQDKLEEKRAEVRMIEQLYLEEQGKEKIVFKKVIKYVKPTIPAVQKTSSQCNLTYGTLRAIRVRIQSHNAVRKPASGINTENRTPTNDRKR